MRVADLEREREALDLRLNGASYRAIAEQQGCNVSTAHDRVQRGLERLVPVDKAEQLRQVEAERLDAVGARLLYALAKTARDTEDAPLDVDALTKVTTAYVGLAKRKAALLGLDVPVVQRFQITDEVDARIEALVAELSGQADPEDEDELVEP